MENILGDHKFGYSRIRENFIKEQSQSKNGKVKKIDENFPKKIGKRIFDLTISIITLVFILSWLFPIIAIFIKLDSKGPVFFKQLRHGRGNKLFYC